MEKSESELTACCGLYCGDCIRYRSRAADLARELLGELEKTGFDRYAAIKSSPARQMDTVRQFRHYRECREVLEAIAALQCSLPCRAGGGCLSFSCKILECCRNKDYEGCWQCDGYESCGKLEPLASIHGDSPRRNLKLIKEMGTEAWAGHRRKPYVWQ